MDDQVDIFPDRPQSDPNETSLEAPPIQVAPQQPRYVPPGVSLASPKGVPVDISGQTDVTHDPTEGMDQDQKLQYYQDNGVQAWMLPDDDPTKLPLFRLQNPDATLGSLAYDASRLGLKVAGNVLGGAGSFLAQDISGATKSMWDGAKGLWHAIAVDPYNYLYYQVAAAGANAKPEDYMILGYSKDDAVRMADEAHAAAVSAEPKAAAANMAMSNFARDQVDAAMRLTNHVAGALGYRAIRGMDHDISDADALSYMDHQRQSAQISQAINRGDLQAAMSVFGPAWSGLTGQQADEAKEAFRNSLPSVQALRDQGVSPEDIRQAAGTGPSVLSLAEIGVMPGGIGKAAGKLAEGSIPLAERATAATMRGAASLADRIAPRMSWAAKHGYWTLGLGLYNPHMILPAIGSILSAETGSWVLPKLGTGLRALADVTKNLPQTELGQFGQRLVGESAAGAAQFAPLAVGSDNLDDAAKQLSMGIGLGVAHMAGSAALATRYELLRSLVRLSGTDPYQWSTQHYDYGVDPAKDDLHYDDVQTWSNQNQNLINMQRHAMQNAVRVYSLAPEAYDSMFRPEGTPYTHGMYLQSGEAITLKDGTQYVPDQAEIYYRGEDGFKSAKAHEPLHAIWDGLTQDEKTAFARSIFKQNNPSTWASMYYSKLYGKPIKVDYESLPDFEDPKNATGMSKQRVLEEAFADTIRHFSIDQITSNPGLIRKVQYGIARMMEGLGVPMTPAEIRGTLGISPTAQAMFIAENAMRDFAKDNYGPVTYGKPRPEPVQAAEPKGAVQSETARIGQGGPEADIGDVGTHFPDAVAFVRKFHTATEAKARVRNAISEARNMGIQPKLEDIVYRALNTDNAWPQELINQKKAEIDQQAYAKSMPGMAEAHAQQSDLKSGEVMLRTHPSGKQEISGNELNPDREFHQKMVELAGLQPEHVDLMNQLGAATGVPVQFEYRSGEGRTPGQVQQKTFVPQKIVYNPEAKSFVVRGFSPDKLNVMEKQLRQALTDYGQFSPKEIDELMNHPESPLWGKVKITTDPEALTESIRPDRIVGPIKPSVITKPEGIPGKAMPAGKPIAWGEPEINVSDRGREYPTGVESKDGRFSIEANFYDKDNPQDYTLHDEKSGVKKTFDTFSQAKKAAEEWITNPPKPPENPEQVKARDFSTNFKYRSLAQYRATRWGADVVQNPDGTFSIKARQQPGKAMPQFDFLPEDKGFNAEDQDKLGRNLWLSPQGKFYNAGNHQDWAAKRVTLKQGEKLPDEPIPYNHRGWTRQISKGRFSEDYLKSIGWARMSHDREGNRTYFVNGNSPTPKQFQAMREFEELNPDYEFVYTGALDTRRFGGRAMPGETLASGLWDKVVTDGHADELAKTLGLNPGKRYWEQKPEDRQKILDYYRSTGQARYMPAGDPKSEEFKNWFGNSVVTNKHGEPMVVGHGGFRKIDDFVRKGGLAGHFGPIDQASRRILHQIEDAGRWIDPSLDDDRGWLRDERPTEQLAKIPATYAKGARITPVFLSIKNPYRMSDVHFDDARAMFDELEKDGRFDSNPQALLNLSSSIFDSGLPEWQRMRRVVKYLESQGYDGIVYRNNIEGRGEDSYIPFRPEQIRSAMGTAPRYMPSQAGPLIWTSRHFDMTPDQLEQFLIFGKSVAGHKSAQRAPVVEKMLTELMDKYGGTSPITALQKAYQDPGAIEALARKHGLGPYQDIVPFLEHLATNRIPDLKTATEEELMQIPGIGPKTARFFKAHTDATRSNNVMLDTHILGFMRENGYPDAPRTTPQNPDVYEKWSDNFRKVADEFGLTPSDLDLQIWLDRSGNMPKEAYQAMEDMGARGKAMPSDYGYLGHVTDEGDIEGDKFFPGYPGPKGHDTMNFDRGLLWRYNPDTQKAYWWSPFPGQAEKSALESWLGRHGEQVQGHVNLDLQKLGVDRYGDLVDEAHMYNPGNLPGRAMPSVSDIGFYSQLEKVTEDKIHDGMTKDQILASLKKAGGVKDNEIKWVLGDFLERNPNPTRTELLDYIKANKVQVQEVQRSGGLTRDLNDPNVMVGNAAKYEQENLNLPGYTPGSYRELLLTLRRPGVDTLPDGWYTEPATPATFGPAIWKWVTRNQRGEAVGYGKTQEEAQQHAMNYAGEDKVPAFGSSHFSEPNIVAHMRVAEYKTPQGEPILVSNEFQSDWAQGGREKGFQGKVDPASLDLAEGDRVWSYTDPKSKESIQVSKGPTNIARIAGNAKSEPEARQIAANWLSREGVPDMPFKSTDSWTSLLLKRMIKYAVDHGYDKIGWTTGDSQAERYDLSKHVDSIDVNKSRNGGYRISLYKDGEALSHNVVSDKELDANVGKDLAAKIRQDMQDEPQGGVSKTYSGLDLKVGGEGMRSYYDQIVPKVANQIGKQYGVKTTQGQVLAGPTEALSAVSLGYLGPKSVRPYMWKDGDGNFIGPQFKTDIEAHDWRNGHIPENVTIHTLDIPPAMADTVRVKGQPLFMPSDHPQAVERAAIQDKTSGKVFPAANPRDTHMMIPLAHPDEVPAYGTMAYWNNYHEGFQDRQGQFLDREQALERMRQLRQLPESYKGRYATEADVTDLNKAQGLGRAMPQTGQPFDQVLFRGHAGDDPSKSMTALPTFTDSARVAGTYAGTFATDLNQKRTGFYRVQMNNPLVLGRTDEDVVELGDLRKAFQGKVPDRRFNNWVKDFDDSGKWRYDGDWTRLSTLTPEQREQAYTDTYRVGDDGHFVSMAKQAGYDGLIARGTFVTDIGEPGQPGLGGKGWGSYDPTTLSSMEYRPFSPSQVQPANLPARYMPSYEDARFDVSSPQAIKDTLRNGNRWAILSAAQGRFSEAQNQARIALLKDELDQLGLKYQEVEGNYQGSKEPSLMIQGITSDQASKLGRKYGQESVLVPEGLRYSDGRLVPASGSVETKASPFKSDYTKVGDNYFQYGLNFDQEIPAKDMKVIRSLPQDEQDSVFQIRNGIASLLDTYRKAKSRMGEAVKGSLQAQAHKNWYDDAADLINKIFDPVDADRFTALTAALSANTAVTPNIEQAVQVWDAWEKAGRPTDHKEINNVLLEGLGNAAEVLQQKAGMAKTRLPNVIRALTAEDPSPQALHLSGAKVSSFFSNLTNHPQMLREVTNDRHMSNFWLQDPEAVYRGTVRRQGVIVKSPTYMALSQVTRDLAKKLSKIDGREWTPRQAQAALWSYQKAKEGGALGMHWAGKEKSIENVPNFTSRLQQWRDEKIQRATATAPEVEEQPF